MANRLVHILKYIVFAVSLICFGYVLSTGSKVSSYGMPVIYYIGDQPVDLAQLEEMEEEEKSKDDKVSFASYGTLHSQDIINEDLGRTNTCDLMYIYGNSSLICTSTGELMNDDTDGCILSTAAAWKIFGESKVKGGKVLYNNKEYIIRGVLENDDPVMIVNVKALQTIKRRVSSSAYGDDYGDYEDSDDYDESDYDEDDSGNYDDEGGSDPSDISSLNFDKIIIKPSKTGVKRIEQIRVFENRWGYGSNKTDCQIYQRINTFLIYLIPALILIILMIRCLAVIIGNFYRPVRLILSVIITAILFVLFFIICGVTPSIPVDLIPNRWSDFEFWSKVISSVKDSIYHILYISKAEIELSFYSPILGMIAYEIAAVITFLISSFLFFTITGRKSKAYLVIIIVCLIELAVIYYFHTKGVALANIKLLLYLWPYYVLGYYLCQFNRNDKADDEEYGNESEEETHVFSYEDEKSYYDKL